MKKRITSLSFIIGLFFLLVAFILLIGYFVGALLANRINLYAGICFLLFGLFMTTINPENDSSE